MTQDPGLKQPRFRDLSASEQAVVIWEMLRLQARVLFSNRFAWFMAGILAFYVVVYIINFNQPVVQRMTREAVFSLLLEFPLSLLAVYLNMQLLTAEKENRTLEVMFTTAGGRYKVWLQRLGTLYAILLALCFLLSSLAFFTIADLPIVGMALNAFVPVFFVGNMTLYFAVRFRSGLAAGMVSAGILLILLMFSELLNETRYFLFFNPYNVPRSLDPETWELWMWQNRAAVLFFGGLLLFLALRGMEIRERLLR